MEVNQNYIDKQTVGSKPDEERFKSDSFVLGVFDVIVFTLP